jgi:hypothetical protein
MSCAVTAQVVVGMGKELSMTRTKLSKHSQLEEVLHWPGEAHALSIGCSKTRCRSGVGPGVGPEMVVDRS